MSDLTNFNGLCGMINKLRLFFKKFKFNYI
jgi:hypothetical protein